MSTDTLAVEIYTEELPPKALRSLGDAFANGVAGGLRQRGLLSAQSSVTTYATPRRLGVAITAVLAQAPDQPFEQKLMPKSVALGADGNATIALRRKLEAIGRGGLADAWPEAIAGSDALIVKSDGKVEAIFLRSVAPGASLQVGLESALEETLARLPIPKVMSYAAPGSYFNDVKFVRPAHRLVALHGPRIVPVHVLALNAGRTTGGHRLLSRGEIEIATAEAYAPTLEAEGKIMPSFAARREAIVEGLRKNSGGAMVIMPDNLLDEVTALVEWPAVLAGSFDAGYLSVPHECLILTMQQNQKYFALADSAGQLTNRFLLVSNLVTEDPNAIVAGNERVLRARLADAKFFFDQDRKSTLESRLPKLAGIVYHNKLGSQGQRALRLAELSAQIAPMLGTDAKLAKRAGLLAKADLVTDMVGEFPELQGTMGRYYALHDGEAPEVADAIAQHYWPRFAGDALPKNKVAIAAALADKLDMLAGLFGIGEVPTGERDPFGLRRAAIGVLRILIENRLALSLQALMQLAFAVNFPSAGVSAAKASSTLADFFHERLRGYLREQGYTANQVSAVIDTRPDVIDDLPDRLAAVQDFEALPEAAALATANKRIVNILKKAEAEAAPAVDRTRLEAGAEHDLYMAFQKLAPAIEDECARGDYGLALKALAAVKPTVDRFFDAVMVMADDPALRANRLALLRGVAATMNRVADISKLAS